MGTGERTSWVPAGEPTERILRVERRSDSGYATSWRLQRKRCSCLPRQDPDFRQDPATGELTRPVINAPERVDHTGTSLSSKKSSRMS
jgi:hypothetical protein